VGPRGCRTTVSEATAGVEGRVLEGDLSDSSEGEDDAGLALSERPAEKMRSRAALYSASLSAKVFCDDAEVEGLEDEFSGRFRIRREGVNAV